jgi:uncharacterized damage-inducible protein DinB
VKETTSYFWLSGCTIIRESLSQLQALLEESQTRILAGLACATPEFLAAKLDEDTRAEHITFSIWHETYHVGQLELLRQLAGKNDKII